MNIFGTIAIAGSVVSNLFLFFSLRGLLFSELWLNAFVPLAAGVATASFVIYLVLAVEAAAERQKHIVFLLEQSTKSS